MLLSSSDTSPWSQAIWGRCEGRVCDCAESHVSSFSSAYIRPGLGDTGMSRNSLVLPSTLMLQRGLTLTPQLWVGCIGYSTAPILRGHLCFVFMLHCYLLGCCAFLSNWRQLAAKYPKEAPALYCQFWVPGFSRQPKAQPPPSADSGIGLPNHPAYRQTSVICSFCVCLQNSLLVAITLSC